MNRRTGSFRHDRRGVSVGVGYVLNLAIAALLVSGLLFAVGDVLESRTEIATDEEFEVLGNQVAGHAATADRLARAGREDQAETGVTPSVAVETRLPSRVAGSGYRMHVEPDSVELVADATDVSVTVPVRTGIPLAETTVRGGPIRIEYDHDPDDPELVVTEQ